MTGSDPEQD